MQNESDLKNFPGKRILPVRNSRNRPDASGGIRKTAVKVKKVVRYQDGKLENLLLPILVGKAFLSNKENVAHKSESNLENVAHKSDNNMIELTGKTVANIDNIPVVIKEENNSNNMSNNLSNNNMDNKANLSFIAALLHAMVCK